MPFIQIINSMVIFLDIIKIWSSNMTKLKTKIQILHFINIQDYFLEAKY
jgi:hypothetical protein